MTSSHFTAPGEEACEPVPSELRAADACCHPRREVAPGALYGVNLSTGLDAESRGSRHRTDQAHVPAQNFLMGDSQGDGLHADGEMPVHLVTLPVFEIDVTTVSNTEFQRFIEATGHRTEAELFGISAVFDLAVEADQMDILGHAPRTPWWITVRGADWAHPGGRQSSLQGREDHPAVHVSWNDAMAYCAWAGRSLPTEAQWEAASRGGLSAVRYPWGNTLNADRRANIWEGRFPVENVMPDGWLTTVPVHFYEPNGYGLWQTVGNVWEWCSDWWSSTYYRESPHCEPAGPTNGTARVMRGGSYLCHDSYCNRYRNAARTSNTPDSSMGNAGFRTVSSPMPEIDAAR